MPPIRGGVAATQIAGENRGRIQAFLKASGTETPARVADCVAATKLGLSAAAREGCDETRLLAVAEAAAAGLDHFLFPDPMSPKASS